MDMLRTFVIKQNYGNSDDVSSAAYQIEGGRTDGKGDSIWDTFAHKEGKIVNGETGE